MNILLMGLVFIGVLKIESVEILFSDGTVINSGDKNEQSDK